MKKVLATILALVMALGLTATAWATEGGTEGGAVAEMGGINYDDLHAALEAAKDGGTVKLLGDVNLTGDWTPVGNSTTPFKGTFDGNGHKITGLKITSGSYIGLFGYVGAGAVIRNVNLVGASVSGESRVGALIGCIVGDATVSNCSVDSTSVVVGTGSNTGGLIGEAAGTITVTLKYLTNNASVTNMKNGTSRAAGIIAQVTSGANVTITNCVNNGAITTNNGYAGGIVAAKQGSSEVSFENCSNARTLTGKYTGSLIAWLVDGNRLSMTNSGDARTAIGAVNISRNEGYTFYFTIDGEEYYIRKQGGEADSDTKFSELWDGKKTIDRAYMDRIIAFFNYAKSEQGEGGSFAAYPSDYAELFAYAWNTSDHTRKNTMFGAEGWPELLSRYNEAKKDNMTRNDFAVIWDKDILYSAPAPAPTPDPTPSTGGYYYYHPTTDTKADGTKGSPKTFDAGVGIYAVTAVLSVTGMAWTAKKRGN